MGDTKSEPTVDASLGRVTYYLALLLVVTPAIDFVANVIPLQFGDLHWRYGTVGLVSGFLMTPILGLLIATVAADALRHGGVLRTLGFIDIVTGVLLFVASVLFVLDLLQVRSAVPADARRTFDIGSFKALAKNLASAVGLAWLGFATLRVGRRARRGRRAAEDTPKLFRTSGSS